MVFERKVFDSRSSVFFKKINRFWWKKIQRFDHKCSVGLSALQHTCPDIYFKGKNVQMELNYLSRVLRFLRKKNIASYENLLPWFLKLPLTLQKIFPGIQFCSAMVMIFQLVSGFQRYVFWNPGPKFLPRLWKLLSPSPEEFVENKFSGKKIRFVRFFTDIMQ